MKTPKNPTRMGFRELLSSWTLGGAGRVELRKGSQNTEAVFPFPHTLPSTSLPSAIL